MKVVYVSGPYKGSIEKHIHQARAVAYWLWRMGFAAICPHSNTAFFDSYLDFKKIDWVKGCLAIVKRCDAVFMFGNWRQSDRAIREYKCAKRRKIPIFFDFDSIEKWKGKKNG